MAAHSSVLAWRTPGTGGPGGLQSLGSQSQTRLSDFTFTFHFHALEKEMATHSSVLAWRTPGTGEPGGLPSMGSQSRTRLKRLSSSSSSSSSKVLCRHLGLTSSGFPLFSVKPSCICKRKLFPVTLSFVVQFAGFRY